MGFYVNDEQQNIKNYYQVGQQVQMWGLGT